MLSFGRKTDALLTIGHKTDLVIAERTRILNIEVSDNIVLQTTFGDLSKNPACHEDQRNDAEILPHSIVLMLFNLLNISKIL